MEIDPFTTEPTEAELREMLEARELEKELQRKRMSRTFSLVLLAAGVVVAGVIYFYPQKPPSKVAAKTPTPALPPTIAGPVPDELKPFSVKPEHNADRDNIRFASELLKFMQPGDPVASPPPQPTNK